jgi:hypothetical protein
LTKQKISLKINLNFRRRQNMAEVSRLWDIMDFDYKLNIKLLYKRPRVDYRISEYIFDYINKNVLEPNKIMQDGNYDICLSFTFFDKDHFKYFDDLPFDTEDTKYSVSKISNRTENGIKYKDISISCYSIELTENIKPKEYASIVYDMIGSFLVSKYKKITKEIMNNNKKGIEYEFIEKFIYPASFENQKYLLDNEEASYFNGETLIEVDVENEYKKYYKE